MSATPDYPDTVNGHHLYRRPTRRHDYIRSIYQCTECGNTAEHTTDFEVFDCTNRGEQA